MYYSVLLQKSFLCRKTFLEIIPENANKSYHLLSKIYFEIFAKKLFAARTDECVLLIYFPSKNLF